MVLEDLREQEGGAHGFGQLSRYELGRGTQGSGYKLLESTSVVIVLSKVLELLFLIRDLEDLCVAMLVNEYDMDRLSDRLHSRGD